MSSSDYVNRWITSRLRGSNDYLTRTERKAFYVAPEIRATSAVGRTSKKGFGGSTSKGSRTGGRKGSRATGRRTKARSSRMKKFVKKPAYKNPYKKKKSTYKTTYVRGRPAKRRRTSYSRTYSRRRHRPLPNPKRRRIGPY